MENESCGSCKYFMRHYIRYDEGDYVPILDGHCKKPRLKLRNAKTPACQYWERQNNNQAESGTGKPVPYKISGTFCFFVECGEKM